MAGASGACQGETNCTTVTPGNIHVYALACSVTVIPGSPSTRVFTLRQGGNDTTLVCTVTSNANSCTARDENGVAISEGTHWGVKTTITNATANNASGGCVLYFNLDAF